MHGAIGYTAEFDLGLWINRVRALVGAWGTPTYHRGAVAALGARPGRLMHFARTEEQDLLAAIVRDLLDKRSDSAAVRAAMESDAGYDESLWQALCEQVGVAALAVPEEYGGVGASLVETAVVLEELGATWRPRPCWPPRSRPRRCSLAAPTSEAARCSPASPPVRSLALGRAGARRRHRRDRSAP